jgi:CheY-like chemotaxis protein
MRDAPQIEFLKVTGWGQPDDRRRSLDAGFDYHLVKPVDPANLRALLEQVP